jgi:hypothetical protein
MSFEPARSKVSIGSLDDSGLQVEAQYNPKELQIDKTVPWAKHNKANANGLQLEFTGAEGRSMSLELMFDGYETKTSIQDKVASLEEMASVRDATSSTDDKRRPHHCVVVWGTVMGGTDNKFKCVIESMSTKYTMFLSDGTPVRATVTLKLKEAERVSMAPASGAASSSSSSDGGDAGG